MRRTAAIAVLTLGLVALLPAGAHAGGADWFEFDRRYYAPGETAVGRTRVWFASEERARMSTQGRFVAYLLPENRWLRPPGVPKAAVPLGPVTFASPEGTTAIATLEFTVPQVPNGDWNVSVCNVPCTDSMIGGLAGSSIRIAASSEMAAIMRLEDRLDARLHVARRVARRDVRGLADEIQSLRTENQVLAGRVDELQADLDEVARRSRRAASPGFPSPIGWVLVALTVLFGIVAFRPRRRPVLHPDPPAIERIEAPEREPVV
jgi:hypothetical protein